MIAGASGADPATIPDAWVQAGLEQEDWDAIHREIAWCAVDRKRNARRGLPPSPQSRWAQDLEEIRDATTPGEIREALEEARKRCWQLAGEAARMKCTPNYISLSAATALGDWPWWNRRLTRDDVLGSSVTEIVELLRAAEEWIDESQTHDIGLIIDGTQAIAFARLRKWRPTASASWVELELLGDWERHVSRA